MYQNSMKKKFSEYDAYVFDLDGTLYFQKKLRMIMASRLFFYYMCHFWQMKDLLIVKKFREVRERWDVIVAKDDLTGTMAGNSIDEAQYKYVSEVMKTSESRVASVIKKWIYDNPLDAVKNSKDAELSVIIESLREQEKTVVIFSDYPTKEKLEALGIEVDKQYCSTDEAIGELKPSPKGLQIILKDINLDASQVLMVGDRMEKDGQCAISSDVDYLILPRSKSGRKYNKIL